MMLRTHLALGILIGMLFFNYVSSPIIFIIILIVATYLPDIDTAFSSVGSHWPFKFLHWFVKHRGFIHSLTMAFVISLVLSFLWPLIALPFFIGYSVHIVLDSFTPEGVAPFWPYRGKSFWKVKTGGKMDTSLFVFLLIADLLVFIFLLIS